MEDLTLYGIAGLLGAASYLAAYGLLQFGLIQGNGYVYTLMNMAAAALVAVSLIDAWNLSSAVIQAWFFCVSIIGIVRIVMRDRRLRFTADELSFAARVMPGLARSDMRQLLDQGRWESMVAGEKLTVQGEPLSHLVYLAEGAAVVSRNEADIAEIGPGDFVGEITYLSGAPTTGTVSLTARSLVFRIPVGRLRRFLDRHPHIHDQLERSLASDLRKKLNQSAHLVATMRQTEMNIA